MNSIINFIKYIAKNIWSLIRFTATKMYTVAIVTTAIILPIIILSIPSEPTDTSSYENSDSSKLEFSYYAGEQEASDKIARINISGVILKEVFNNDPFSFLNEKTVDGAGVKRILKKLADENEVKAVLLNLDTPGGDPEGAKLITEGIVYFKEKTQKPVYGYVDSISTSAGAWISAPLDKIIAKDYALLANVGVSAGTIVKAPSITKYVGGEFIGESKEEVKIIEMYRGKYKRFDNPLNPTDDEIQNIYGELLDGMYDEFLDHMVNYRKMDKTVLKDELGAKALFAKDAIQYKFVDELGNEEFALEKFSQAINSNGDVIFLDTELSNSFGFLESLLGMTKSYINAKLDNNTLQSSYICNPEQILSFYGNIDNYCK